MCETDDETKREITFESHYRNFSSLPPFSFSPPTLPPPLSSLGFHFGGPSASLSADQGAFKVPWWMLMPDSFRLFYSRALWSASRPLSTGCLSWENVNPRLTDTCEKNAAERGTDSKEKGEEKIQYCDILGGGGEGGVQFRLRQSDKEWDGNCAEIRVSGKKGEQNCRERSGETETWQPTKKEKRNGYHKMRRRGRGWSGQKERGQLQKERES